MVRALGIDPGTGSMDLLLIDDEDNRVLYEESIPRSNVTRDPHIIMVRVLELDRKYGVDSVAAPSGYGIPHIHGKSIVDYIMEATFIHEDDLRENIQIQGLRRVMLQLYNSGLNVFFTPGVIQLPTVPRHRKINRIDMGTADKVFTVAATLYDQVLVRGRMPGDESFIVVEAGKAYNAAIAVERGQIVDGIGGTLGGHGFLGAGAFDAEVAYALAAVEGRFSRRRLFDGGAGYIAGELEIDAFSRQVELGESRAMEALELLGESIVKNVFTLLPSLETPPETIYVSGRLFRDKTIGRHLLGKLEASLKRYNLAPSIRRVPRLGKITKEGATGAALLASGYVGGRFKWIVDSLRLRESKGSIFDNLVVGGLSNRAPTYFTRIGRQTLL